MCGITGFSGSFDEAGLAGGVRSLAHRGPDDSGVFIDKPSGIGLGHTRLSIIDLSPLGRQPMTNNDGSVVLVFNGEIYNYHQLRTELESRGHRFIGNSDTEVLLHLYMAEGEAMLPRLNGIFAFAIWDRRTQSLFVARDAVGVKPMYYAVIRRGFVFGSEIKALLRLAPEVRELDAPSIHRYLSFLWCPGDGTPFKAVRKLPPGEAMIIREGKIARRWTWYQLPIFNGRAADLTEAEALSGTVDGLRSAVHRQMVSDVPLGAFLSGGLDSSAVVAFAREQNPDMRCFTIEAAGGQEEGVADDLPYARKVAKYLDVKLEIVHIDSKTMACDLERMVEQLDEPLADLAPLNVLYISRLAREHGIKVLLSGAGGDDLFTGYRRHRAVRAEAYWTWLPRKMRGNLEWITAGLDKRRPWARRLAKMFSGAGLDGDERLANYFLWAGQDGLRSLYTSEFRAQLGASSAVSSVLDFLKPLSSCVTPLERMLALEQRFFLPDHNLIYTDKMSMAAGVEVRVPYLDLDLIDFAARVPARMKQRGSVGKWILKKAMEPYLPREVIYRPKSGFGAPLRRWMRNELRPLLNELLSIESLKMRGIFDPAAVQRLIGQNETGRADAAYTLLALMCIEVWCRSFLDRPSDDFRTEKCA